MIYQLEKCPKTGRLHYQGYVEFDKAYTTKTIKKILNNEGAHLEPRKGTQLEAINYCKKAESHIEGPWEYGEPKEQGKRNDLLAVTEKLKAGSSISTIVKENTETYIKFSKGIERAKFWLDKDDAKKLREVSVELIFGKAGSGKSNKIYELLGDKPYFKLCKDTTGVWWDGYDGEENLWIDEFDGSWMPLTMFLNVLDRYPLRLQTKGAHTWAKWTHIYITANENWIKWYPNIIFEHKKAIQRRIQKVFYMDMYTCTEVPGNTMPALREEEEISDIDE